MKFTNVRALKAHTSELLQAVEEGEEIIITYHGRPRAMLSRIGEDEIGMKAPRRGRSILSKKHPFFKLIGKGTDDARDVSANKYKFLSLAAERKR
jgi:antitoxin (DNA-binding transcriptional repressor) of toxin-antitoxin stability system